MSNKSKIEWVRNYDGTKGSTWNPVTGCTKVSEGCKNCYAERIAKRFWKEPFSEVVCHEDRLDILNHWRKPRKIFVCSMSDLFHKDVPDEFIWKVFDEISHNRRHIYMILTKRPERMKAWFEKYAERFWNYHAPDEPQRPYCAAPWPDPCIWLGVTAENQKMADIRIPILLETPATVRFVSVEPMLSPVELRKIKGDHVNFNVLNKSRFDYGDDGYGVGAPMREGINWVICGCESGSGARPFDWHWAQDLKNQCVNAGVPFFYKQGRYDGKIIKLPELDGRQWMEYPGVK